jgi:hypothetical protein
MPMLVNVSPSSYTCDTIDDGDESSDSESSSSSSLPAEGFLVDGKCYPEGAALYVREYWDSQVSFVVGGVRKSDTIYEFNFNDSHVEHAGLFLADMAVFYPIAGVQTPQFVVRGMLEVSSNGMKPHNNCPMSIAEMRLILRDELSEANFLLDDVEYTDKEIMAALRRVVDYWNAQPPDVAAFTYATFPFRYHWAQGATALLLKQASIHKLRNFLDYQAAGVSINDNARWAQYQQLGSQMWQDFQAWVQIKKISINVSYGYGMI